MIVPDNVQRSASSQMNNHGWRCTSSDPTADDRNSWAYVSASEVVVDSSKSSSVWGKVQAPEVLSPVDKYDTPYETRRITMVGDALYPILQQITVTVGTLKLLRLSYLLALRQNRIYSRP